MPLAKLVNRLDGYKLILEFLDVLNGTSRISPPIRPGVAVFCIDKQSDSRYQWDYLAGYLRLAMYMEAMFGDCSGNNVDGRNPTPVCIYWQL